MRTGTIIGVTSIHYNFGSPDEGAVKPQRGTCFMRVLRRATSAEGFNCVVVACSTDVAEQFADQGWRIDRYPLLIANGDYYAVDADTADQVTAAAALIGNSVLPDALLMELSKDA